METEREQPFALLSIGILAKRDGDHMLQCNNLVHFRAQDVLWIQPSNDEAIGMLARGRAANTAATWIAIRR